jgi:hypothetical protein
MSRRTRRPIRFLEPPQTQAMWIQPLQESEDNTSMNHDSTADSSLPVPLPYPKA